MVIKDAIDRRLERVGLDEAADGHLFVLDVPPEVLNGVQFGGVGRQVEDSDTGSHQGREDLRDEGASMDGVVVQHDDAGTRAPRAGWQLLWWSRQLGYVAPEERDEGGAIDLAAAAVVGQTRLRAIGSQRANDVDASACGAT